MFVLTAGRVAMSLISCSSMSESQVSSAEAIHLHAMSDILDCIVPEMPVYICYEALDDETPSIIIITSHSFIGLLSSKALHHSFIVLFSLLLSICFSLPCVHSLHDVLILVGTCGFSAGLGCPQSLIVQPA